MTEYDPSINAPIAFPKTFPENVLADVLSAAGLRQYHIAETEKYAHVTFFLNGGIEAEKEGEQRTIIASPEGCDLRFAARDERTRCCRHACCSD